MALPGEFYCTTARLALVQDVARARQLPPDLLLAATLARATARISPRVCLPPIIGVAPASLNSSFAIVGASGAGKSLALASAAAVLPVVGGGRPDPVHVENLGSGERLAAIYVRRKRIGADLLQVREAAILMSAEIDEYAALISRTGSTLEPTMRKLWSGEALGNGYVDDLKRLPVPAHAARAMWIVGVQPGRAGALFTGPARSGGTTARLVLFDGTDADAPWPLPPMPDASAFALWGPPGITYGVRDDFGDGLAPVAREPIVLEVGEDIVKEIRYNRHLVLTGKVEPDPLDSHRDLNRLKVAAQLTLMDGGIAVGPDAWWLAGMVLDESTRLRGHLMAGLDAEQDVEQQRRGRLDGIRRDASDDSRLTLTGEAILKHIRDHGQPGGCPVRCIRPAITSGRRKLLLDALADQVDRGALITELRPAERQPDDVTYWRLPGRRHPPTG